MKNTGSVCVLMLAFIFIGSVCAQSKTEEFLRKHGYLAERSLYNSDDTPTPEEMEMAILKFQRFTGLPQTGKLDEPTKKKMIAPRCGVKDLDGEVAEYKTFSKWPQNLITWKIRLFSETSKLSHDQQRRAMSQSLKRWADVTPLEIQEAEDKPTLDIIFAKGDHGDGLPFDGSVSKWPQNLITWKIRLFSETSKLSHDQQRRAMSQSLKRWADVTPLEIQEAEDKPTLDIIFAKGDHGDGLPFDGSGTILAHAFSPENGGTHFDDDENWVNDETEGIHLETVAVHEFGHALGLAHSDEPKSLMAPYYQRFPDGFTLHEDDIAGIQSLYGKNPNGPITSTTSTTRKTTPTSTPHSTTITTPPQRYGFCNHVYENIDAAMRINESDFVFVDNGDVIDGRNGQKMAVQSLFPDGPNTVHAAVYAKNYSKAYLFQDDQVWAYILSNDGQFSLVNTFPKPIPNKNVHKPECAMLDNFHDEKTFLVKDGYFFEFMLDDETVEPDKGYNTSEVFLNIPSRIDAAISSDREIHFIVNEKAYTMPNDLRVVSVKGKPTNLVFNKCQN